MQDQALFVQQGRFIYLPADTLLPLINCFQKALLHFSLQNRMPPFMLCLFCVSFYRLYFFYFFPYFKWAAKPSPAPITNVLYFSIIHLLTDFLHKIIYLLPRAGQTIKTKKDEVSFFSADDLKVKYGVTEKEYKLLVASKQQRC